MTVKIIAEIGVNHEGDFDKAVELIKKAKHAGADFVKFQSYTPDFYTSQDNKERFERVSKFALGEKDFKKLHDISKAVGISFLSTPLTHDWVEKLNPYCEAFKIASGDITFKNVIQKAAQTGKPMLMSTGAATIDEIDRAVSWVEEIVGKENLVQRLTLLHCVASYPTPIDQANIRSIPFLKERYNLPVGYSNHVIEVEACLAAIVLGAEIVEVHFTDEREGRDFRDHELSFNEDMLRDFIVSAKKIEKSLGVFDKKPLPCEVDIIPLIRKGIIASRDIREGEVLSSDNLTFSRPATEFTSNQLDEVLGKKTKANILKGFLIPRGAI